MKTYTIKDLIDNGLKVEFGLHPRGGYMKVKTDAISKSEEDMLMLRVLTDDEYNMFINGKIGEMPEMPAGWGMEDCIDSSVETSQLSEQMDNFMDQLAGAPEIPADKFYGTEAKA